MKNLPLVVDSGCTDRINSWSVGWKRVFLLIYIKSAATEALAVTGPRFPDLLKEELQSLHASIVVLMVDHES